MRIPVHRKRDYPETGIEILRDRAFLRRISNGGKPGNPAFAVRVGWRGMGLTPGISASRLAVFPA
jgi:hypothetical protein